jgi:hypothetical protein
VGLERRAAGIDTPVKVDPPCRPSVAIALKRGRIVLAREWCDDVELRADGGAVRIEVPPGEVRIVEIRER